MGTDSEQLWPIGEWMQTSIESEHNRHLQEELSHTKLNLVLMNNSVAVVLQIQVIISGCGQLAGVSSCELQAESRWMVRNREKYNFLSVVAKLPASSSQCLYLLLQYHMISDQRGSFFTTGCAICLR